MNKQNRFLPTTKEEMKQRGWDELDVVLITGDAYIDSPFMGIAVVLKLRRDARDEKNWALSDKIRDGLQGIGIKIKDGKDTTQWSI